MANKNGCHSFGDEPQLAGADLTGVSDPGGILLHG